MDEFPDMKTVPTFTAQQMPDGKWRLSKNGFSLDIFDSQAEVERAIERIVKPVILYYNEKGEMINELGEKI